jgi:hypothetical protein
MVVKGNACFFRKRTDCAASALAKRTGFIFKILGNIEAKRTGSVVILFIKIDNKPIVNCQSFAIPSSDVLFLLDGAGRVPMAIAG